MSLKGCDYYIRRSRKRKFDLVCHDNEQNGKEYVVIHRLLEEDAHGLLFGLHLGWLSGKTLTNVKKKKDNDNKEITTHAEGNENSNSSA